MGDHRKTLTRLATLTSPSPAPRERGDQARSAWWVRVRRLPGRTTIRAHSKACRTGSKYGSDAAATAAYHRTRDQQRVPMGVVDRLIARENPIRIWREHRGHSLRQLAERAGVGIGYLSQIENGERKGTVGTLKKIAAALDVDLDDLT